jgi:hypothetical protein
MPLVVARAIEFVHIEQVSALLTFSLGEVLLHLEYVNINLFSQKIIVVHLPTLLLNIYRRYVWTHRMWSCFASSCAVSKQYTASL